MGVGEGYPLSPRPGIHEDPQESLQDEEEIHPQPDCH